MPNVNKTYVLIVLLEYIDLFIPSDNMNNHLGGIALLFTILYCFILFYVVDV